MGDFQSSQERLRIEDFKSFDKGFRFLDCFDWIEDFFQPLVVRGDHEAGSRNFLTISVYSARAQYGRQEIERN